MAQTHKLRTRCKMLEFSLRLQVTRPLSRSCPDLLENLPVSPGRPPQGSPADGSQEREDSFILEAGQPVDNNDKIGPLRPGVSLRAPCRWAAWKARRGSPGSQRGTALRIYSHFHHRGLRVLGKPGEEKVWSMGSASSQHFPWQPNHLCWVGASSFHFLLFCGVPSPGTHMSRSSVQP